MLSESRRDDHLFEQSGPQPMTGECESTLALTGGTIEHEQVLFRSALHTQSMHTLSAILVLRTGHQIEEAARLHPHNIWKISKMANAHHPRAAALITGWLRVNDLLVLLLLLLALTCFQE